MDNYLFIYQEWLPGMLSGRNDGGQLDEKMHSADDTRGFQTEFIKLDHEFISILCFVTE
jgi:hypothetical protein